MNKKGFTLVEVLAVIVVLGLLAAIITPVVNNLIKDSEDALYQKQINSVIDATKKYMIDHSDLIPEDVDNATTVVFISDLIYDGTIENSSVINPKTKETMNGCIVVNYNGNYNQYEYNYYDEGNTICDSTKVISYRNITTGEYYYTLKDAFDNVESGSENVIRVIRNVNDSSDSNPTIAASDNVVLDLNGRRLFMNSSLINNEILTIINDGELTTSSAINLIDNRGTLNLEQSGSISNTNTGAYRVISNTGTVNKTGTGDVTSYSSNGYGIVGGNINISDGSIVTHGRDAINTSGNLTITGGNIESSSLTFNGSAIYIGGSGNVTMSGGTVSKLGIGDAGNFVFNSSGTATITGGILKVGELSNSAYSLFNQSSGNMTITNAQIINDGMNTSGTTSAFVNNTGIVQINSGTTISSKNGMALFNYGTGTLSVLGGTVTGGNGKNAVRNHSTGIVEISGGVFSTTSNDAIANGASGTLTVTGGNITTSVSGAGVASANGNLTVTGCTIDAAGFGIYAYQGTVIIGNNSNTLQPTITSTGDIGIVNNNNANVTIYGGTINSTSSYGIYNGSTGTITIENANVTSRSNAIRNYGSGTYIINGGTYLATNGDAVYNNSSGSITMTNGTVTSNTNAGISLGAGTVNVTGGTVIGKTFGIWLNSSNSPSFTLGTNDNTIISASPVISAPTGEGVKRGAGSTFNFYDGKLIGSTSYSTTGSGTLVTPSGTTIKTVANGTSETATLGWATDSKDTLLINDSTEYSKTSTVSAGNYEALKEYVVNAPFAAGEVYQMEVDIKGTPNKGIVNYFYGGSNYLRVGNWNSITTGQSGTSGDGNNAIYQTNEWAHYEVRFTLSSTGDGSVNKYLLFRIWSGNTASIKNIKLYKINSANVTINPNGGTYNDSTSTVSVSEKIGNQINIATPTRSGYTFGGWLPTKSAYSATWAEVFYHNYGFSNRLFSNANDWAEAKSVDLVDKYSILGQLEKFRANTSQKFEFLLEYDNSSLSSGYNRWKQTANPVTTSLSDGTSTADIVSATGYEDVHIDWTAHAWKGLARSTVSNTFIDGSMGSSSWWYAIGAKDSYQSGIPATNSIAVTNGIHLWVKVNDNLSNITQQVTGVVGTNGKYIPKHDVTLTAIWIPN